MRCGLILQKFHRKTKWMPYGLSAIFLLVFKSGFIVFLFNIIMFSLSNYNIGTFHFQ